MTKPAKSIARPPEPAKEIAPKTDVIKMLVVDDHPLVRRGLVETLRDEFKNAVIGEASNAQAALELVWKEEWHVVVLDVAMPGRSGLDVLKEVKHERPKLPVLILSTHSEDQFAIRSLKSGASGYLTKETAGQELVAAVKRVLAGGKYIRASLAEKLASHLDSDASKPLHHALSDREYQVLRMIAYGQTVKEIASDLSISIKTVSTYRSRILQKMVLKNNAELMRYAMEHGLVEMHGAAQPVI
jgi:two-component system invasion response regulator UvrY